jgi:phage tail-like protein
MEGHELHPRGQMEAVLYFYPPTDCFESEEALRPGESLKLDYQGRIYVYYGQQETERSGDPPEVLPSMESADFNLYVRPRSLYQDFLPEIYREVDFIGRLLKIFEQAFEPAVQALDVLWAYLDPLTAPETLLPFLAYWVGWPLTPSLSLSRQRYLICQAMELYRWRGTRRGLRLYLHLYTDLPLDEHLPEEDKHISIQEVFGRGFLLGETHLNQGSTIGGGQLYHFIVLLRPDNPGQLDERLVRQIIEQEKPAFCTYELYIAPTP